MAAIAVIVLAIPYLVERGYGAGFAAFAVGLVGLSQIPGRLIFAPLAARLSSSVAVAGVLALVGVGIAVLAGARGNAAVIAGLVLLGMGNGMALLARATVIADRYGSATYGALSGVAASVTTAAHGLGPVAGATFAAVAGYPALLWALAGLTVAAAALAWCSEPAPSS
jgi:cyanate permease